MSQDGRSPSWYAYRPPSGRGPGSKGLILIVEDDRDIAKMLQLYFDSQGYETLVQRQGADVLTTCLRNFPDVVILDTSLPDMSAFQIYRELRADLDVQHIPVAFLPEEGEAHWETDAVELGKNDAIVTKPFDIEDLKRYIVRVVPKLDPYE